MAILTQYWSLDVGLVLLSAFAAAYIYMTRNFSYWLKRGATEIPPMPFFGNFFDCFLLRASSSVHLAALYDQGKDLPYLGFYLFDKPALLLRDPNIIRAILIKDFNCFVDRYVSTNESDTLGSANMFLLKQPKWKGLRSKISPIFTSGKLKNMFPLMEDVGNSLVAHLNNLNLEGDGTEINMKNIFTRYSTDVITTCAFGLHVDSLNDPNSQFQKCGTQIFGFTDYLRCAELSAFFFAPSIVKLLNLQFFSKEASDFMRRIFTKTLTLREETNTHRHDLIDLLLHLKRTQDPTDNPNELKLEGDNLVGQAATFFAAGSETSASTVSYCLYELALQPDIQSKLREEISSALEENDGIITYDMVMTLPYLDMVVSETLRKYPSLLILDRVAGCDYKVPGTDLVIVKDTPVFVSVLGLHRDPKHFPEPEKYDPERFSKENKQKLPSCVYMPFGDGPRNCIALRFALLAAKLGVFRFISNYEVSPSARTPIPLCFDPAGFLLQPKGGMFLHARRIPTAEESSS